MMRCFFIAIFCFILAACGSPNSIPNRPDGIPENAYWAWGPKNGIGPSWGDWVACEVTGSVTMTCDRYSRDGAYFVRSYLRVCLGVTLTDSELSRYKPYIPRVEMAGDGQMAFEGLEMFSERPPEFHLINESTPLDSLKEKEETLLKVYRERGVDARCNPVSAE